MADQLLRYGEYEYQVLIVDQSVEPVKRVNGKVTLVNEDGTVWSPSGGSVTSDDITDATAVGKAVLTADDAAAALGAIGAATAAQGSKADSAVQPGDLGTASAANVCANLTAGATVDDLIAALIASGLMASA